MSQKPTIKPAKNGPYVVTNCEVLKNFSDGKMFETSGTVALCRCGGSKNKPFCDGTHARNGFTDEKAADRVPDARDTYVGPSITVYDNRGICAHAGRCTDGLPSVFRLREEPFVRVDAETAEAIIATIEKCPSGALSYAVDGVEHPDREGDPMIFIAPNGPYVIVGGAALEDAAFGEGASRKHLALCRCGKSQNKPFCSGAHWHVQFDEHAPPPEE